MPEEPVEQTLEDAEDALDKIAGDARRTIQSVYDTGDNEPEGETVAPTVDEESKPSEPEEEPATEPDTGEVPTREEVVEDEPVAEVDKAEEPPAEETPKEEEKVEAEEEEKPILEIGDLKFTATDLQDPEKVKEAQREIQEGYLRQGDYTQKQQRRAETERQSAQLEEGRKRVYRAVVNNDKARELLHQHPQALEGFLADPDSAMAVLQDDTELAKLWKQMDAIAANPELAKGLVDTTKRDDTQQRLDDYAEVEELRTLIGGIENSIAEIGKEYPDVEQEDVGRWLWAMGGISDMEKATQQEVVDALKRVQGLVEQRRVEDDGSGNEVIRRYLDTNPIRDRFEVMAKNVLTKKADAEAEVEEHNAATDEALKGEETAPPVPPKGTPPAEPVVEVKGDRFKTVEDVEDFLDDIAAKNRKVLSGYSE